MSTPSPALKPFRAGFLTFIYAVLTLELFRNPAFLAGQEKFTLFKVLFLCLVGAVLFFQGGQALFRAHRTGIRVLGGLLALSSGGFLLALAFRYGQML